MRTEINQDLSDPLNRLQMPWEQEPISFIFFSQCLEQSWHLVCAQCMFAELKKTKWLKIRDEIDDSNYVGGPYDETRQLGVC